MLNPELAEPGWHPRFVDYLYLSFTNAADFGPSDTLPLTRWAKLLMLLQSWVSIVTVVLVAALLRPMVDLTLGVGQPGAPPSALRLRQLAKAPLVIHASRLLAGTKLIFSQWLPPEETAKLLSDAHGRTLQVNQ
jgi:hypothetical protein